MDQVKNDEYFMRLAMVEAEKSLNKDEVPIGAVMVYKDKILCHTHNETISRNDPTAHAEILAIKEACKKIKNYRLNDFDLYVTLEPCPMCMGAIVHSRIRRLVFGAHDSKWGAVESIMSFPLYKMNHHVETKGGVLADECGRILKCFFKSKR
ncbi:MAG: tRNA adenosine(34) deaminase TadA [Candidatus Aminicenantes bacterium]|nr:tRNA adenosine(34) deaminase TadA [Candidatus Aminicenantes bacterium]